VVIEPETRFVFQGVIGFPVANLKIFLLKRRFENKTGMSWCFHRSAGIQTVQGGDTERVAGAGKSGF
tara:strand:- start:120 stop:320 length:201 start_codon:yes stop_codon:yes gene_type:complete